jgi:prevent-host-death family protein
MGIYTIVQAKDQLSKLIDEALEGKPVTITRHGKPVVSLLPARAEPRPMTKEEWSEFIKRRESRPRALIDSVAAVREMRDEDP